MRTWIEKQKYLIDYSAASLSRRMAKNLGLLVVYAGIVFVLASVMLFTNALRKEAAAILANSPEVIVQRMMAGRHDLMPVTDIDRIGQIRGVQQKEGRLWGYYYDRVVGANYTVMVPPAASGSAPETGCVNIGAGLARARQVGPGNLLALRPYSGGFLTLSVKGVLAGDSELASADLLLLNEADFRKLFDYPAGYYTDIVLSVANPTEAPTVASKIAARLPGSRPILREEILRTYESIFNWREGIVLAFLSCAILAFAIFAWERASGLSAEEKREIGILKAIGWETGDVIRMKVWEGVLISLTAFLLGYVAAFVHVFHFSATLFEPVLKGWSVLYPHFDLHPAVDGFQIATLFFFTVFPYTIATTVPVWRAAVTDPDAVMRG
jgi:ABC-type lipoprotein release transport system permease subunit